MFTFLHEIVIYNNIPTIAAIAMMINDMYFYYSFYYYGLKCSQMCRGKMFYHPALKMFHSSQLTYMFTGIFKSTCHIDVRWFPFDLQRCDLKFGSWTYGGWSLDLQMIDADITGYIANGEWDLVGKVIYFKKIYIMHVE